jgi:dynein intermediate chain 1
MRNQFNFSERTSLTLNNGHKERGTMTEPPPSVEYAGQATQWEMFDAYMEDHEKKREAERKQKKGGKGGEAEKKEADGAAKPAEATPESTIHGAEMAHASKILERMVNQNTYDDITHDFCFWEDASDLYREGEGTLLPLWKFYNEKTKRKHVTSVKWNSEYPDLFAVSLYARRSFMFLRDSWALRSQPPPFRCSFRLIFHFHVAPLS